MKHQILAETNRGIPPNLRIACKTQELRAVSVADFTHATLTLNIAHYYKLPRKTAAKQYEVAKETESY